MYALVAVALVAVGVLGWLLDRRAQSPLMRQRVNAGSDRYFAERARERAAAAYADPGPGADPPDGPGFDFGDWGGADGCDAGGGGGGDSCD